MMLVMVWSGRLLELEGWGIGDADSMVWWVMRSDKRVRVDRGPTGPALTRGHTLLDSADLVV